MVSINIVSGRWLAGVVLLSVTGLGSAREFNLDYLGEIDDQAHPAGYREYVEMGCYQCHGFQGQGASSPPLRVRLLPYEGFANQVRRPVNVMPAYSPNVLTDKDLQRIYGYLQALGPIEQAKDIPLLNQP